MEQKNRYFLMMEDEVNNLSIEDIRDFAKCLLYNLPDYFFTVPASSSGKYHPAGDLGEGGLVRHSICVRKMLDHLFELAGYFELTDREKVLLEVAALFHDGFKSGTQEEYEKDIHTKFLHPVYAANFIILQSVRYSFPYDDANFIASAIISHMGQWDSTWKEIGTLPHPITDGQKALHLADFLASRKDINMDIPDVYVPDTATTVDENKKESD